MVKRLKLNEKSVREAERSARVYQIFDTDVRGFSLSVYPSGNRAFTLDYRISGRQRRMVIGRWPEWTTVAARERAKELRRCIDEGIDPLAERQSAREAPRVSDMITRYLEEHTPHLAPKNASDQHTIMHKMVAPEWGNRLVRDITKSDVEKLLNKVAAGRSRPSKAKPNNRARKLQGPKPKALDRAMQRAAQRLKQTGARVALNGSVSTAGRSRHRNGTASPMPSADEKAAFYADLVNSDRFLPANTISNSIRDAMLERGLVTPERLRERGVR